MFINTAADTVELIGHIVIAYTALAVHERFRKDHQITEAVYREMRRERVTGMVGLILIIIGYLLEVYADYYVN